MRKFGAAFAVLAIGASLAAQGAYAQAAPAPAAPPNEGSHYLQCDGDANNMSAGESAARLIGAVTLLGIFAKPHEAADPSKRKFGEAGVAACTMLLEGATKEGNPGRRIPLILGRALHRIEAKQYDAAIADIKLAREEAQTAGFMADPAYRGSQARSFDEIEGAALLRLGRYAEAREALLRSAMVRPRSVVALLSIPTYREFLREASPGELDYLARLARTQLWSAPNVAQRLEEVGRFKEAAALRAAVVDFELAATPDLLSSRQRAQAAVSFALAGDRERAAKYAAEARDNFDKRIAGGKPESDSAAYVEIMDLYNVIETAAAGDVRSARRLFAARSQWVSASFGAVVETNRLLREGAAHDELIGGLALDPDEMWKRRADARLAQIAEEDKGNKTLFALIERVERPAETQVIAKTVWRTDKDKMLLKRDAKSTTKSETLFAYGYGVSATTEAYLMHAALLAKSRGQQGFVISNVVRNDLVFGEMLTGNPGDPGLPALLFNNADEVIGDLKPSFPDPSIKPVAK